MKKSFRLAGVILMLAMLFGFLGCEQLAGLKKEAEPAKGSISGKVTFQSGVTDFSGINVFLEKLDSTGRSLVLAEGNAKTDGNSYYASTTTAADGSYEFTELVPGQYTVYATNGDEAAYRSATVTEGSSFTVEDMQLVLKGSITGTLKVTGGEAAGSIVGVAGTSYIAFVAEDGTFTISGVPAGTHKLCVSTNGKYEAFATEYTVDGKTAANAGIISVTIEAANENGTHYVTVRSVENGINFSGTILSNISGNEANVTVQVRNNTTGIAMYQDWKKSSGSWDSWSLTYPLVEKGKEYEFTVSVSNANWTIYYEKFTIKAESGLGEFKVENTDQIKTLIDSDRVIKRTEKPEFTKNDKVRILSQGTSYALYRDKLWSGMWMYETSFWDDSYNQELPLKKLKDISGWRDFDFIDTCLKGHNYEVTSHTEIKIAGFTYNDTVYFAMNDGSSVTGEWGGNLVKVAVLFNSIPDEILANYPMYNYVDLPGKKTALTTISKTDEGGTKTETYTFNALIVNYGDSIDEPLNMPYVKDVNSKFNYWINQNGGSRISFPYSFTPSKKMFDSEKTTVKINDEEFSYAEYILPNITITLTATLMDGETKLKTEEFTYGRTPSYTPKKDGYIFAGWYFDSELTKKFDADKVQGDVTLYAKFLEAKTLYTGSSNVALLAAKEVADVSLGDTLYFELYYDGHSNSSYETGLRIRDGDYNSSEYVNYRINGGETVLVPFTLTDLNFFKNVKQYGLYTSTQIPSISIKSIAFAKGQPIVQEDKPFTVYYNSSVGEAQFNNLDVVDGLEIEFADISESDLAKIKFAFYSDTSIGYGYTYEASSLKNTFVFKDILEKKIPANGDGSETYTLKDKGATSISSVSLIYYDSNGNGNLTLKVKSAKLILSNGSKISVVPYGSRQVDVLTA